MLLYTFLQMGIQSCILMLLPMLSGAVTYQQILVISFTNTQIYTIDCIYSKEIRIHGNLFTLSLGAIAQSDANFNCTFSECAGELLTCYCSVPSGILHWWGRNKISTTESLFCISIDRNQTEATRRSDLNVVAEVVDRSSSGGFTSRLVRQNISTELNNTVLGCSRSQNMDSICRPSSTDLNPNFSLAVTVCQGNDNSGKQYICNVSHFHQLQLLVY